MSQEHYQQVKDSLPGYQSLLSEEWKAMGLADLKVLYRELRVWADKAKMQEVNGPLGGADRENRLRDLELCMRRVDEEMSRRLIRMKILLVRTEVGEEVVQEWEDNPELHESEEFLMRCARKWRVYERGLHQNGKQYNDDGTLK